MHAILTAVIQPIMMRNSRNTSSPNSSHLYMLLTLWKQPYNYIWVVNYVLFIEIDIPRLIIFTIHGGIFWCITARYVNISMQLLHLHPPASLTEAIHHTCLSSAFLHLLICLQTTKMHKSNSSEYPYFPKMEPKREIR